MTQRGACAWIDASGGASGDMLLGALLDAGAQLEAVAAAERLGVPVRSALDRAAGLARARDE